MQLAARGDQVIAFDPVAVPEFAGCRNISYFEGDITEMSHIAEVFSGTRIDAVVHCAAIVGVVASIKNPRKVMQVNVEGSLNVFEAMRIFGVKRIVHISSNEVYGDAETEIVDEGHPLRPRMPYGISKVAVEQLGRTYRDLYGLECINLRGSWIYAPDFPRPRLPNLLVTPACRGESVHLPGGAESVMDYVHADDFVDAVLATLDRAEHAYDAYNIGSGVGTSLAELADIVKSALPGADISVGRGLYAFQPGLPMCRQRALNIRRARKELGFIPKYSINKGIAELVSAKNCEACRG